MKKFKCPGCGLKPFAPTLFKLGSVCNSYKCPGCESKLIVKFGIFFNVFLVVIIAFAILVSGLNLGVIDKSVVPANMNFVHQMDWDCFGIVLAIPILKFIDVQIFGWQLSNK